MFKVVGIQKEVSMAKDYTVLLRAKIDPAGLDFSAIDKKIADINKKAYKIMLEVDTLGLKDIEKRLVDLSSKLQKGNAPIRMVDAEHEISMLNQIEKKMDEIRSKKGSVSGYSISTTPGKEGESDLTSATVKYTNAQKQAITETYKWVNAAEAGEKEDMRWAKTKENLTDNVKANEDAMARAKQKASEYLEKIKSLNQSNENVIKGKSIAQQLIGETDPAKIQQLSKQLDVVKQSSQGARAGILSFTEGMKSSMARTLQYSLSLGLLYGALNQLKQGVQYIKDLNKEMTNIQIVTGMTSKDVNSLSSEYNSLAKEMGVTTIEISKSSVEWFRQGKTVQQTSELIKSSMMLSKLGNIESAQSTEYLTSMINGFNLKAEDSVGIIDKLIVLDNAFATSSSEIASAMQRSSLSAKQAGVSFNELAAMITVVSDVSRRAPESIGESFKTMFARYQDILLGGVDEEGSDINNVGKALDRVGISIRDANGGFKDFSLVLDELYPKWGKLGEVEQANILKAMAGTRQRESLLVLLNNQTKYEKALEIQLGSTGTALDRYNIYLQSAEAAQNRMTASWEKLAQGTVTSGMISNFYDMASAVMEFMSQIGGIPAIIGVIITSLIAFNTTAVLSTIGITTMADAWAGFVLLVESSNPIGWVVLAIGAAVLALNYFNETTQETIDRLNGLQREVDNLASSVSKLNKDKDAIKELWKEFETLESKTSMTSDEQERFYAIQSQLRDLLPTVSGYYDEQGNFILTAGTNLEILIALKQEELDIDKEKLALANEKARVEAIEAYKKSRKDIEKISSPRQVSPGNTQSFNKEQLSGQLEDAALAQKAFINQIKTNYYSLEKAEQEIVLAMLKNGDEIDKQIASQLESFATSVESTEAVIEGADLVVDLDAAKKAYDEGIKEVLASTIEMIKQKKNAEKDALEEQLKGLKDNNDAQKDYYKYQLEEIKRASDEKKKILDREAEEQKRNYDLQKKAVEEQLDAYKKIIDNQKESLDLLKEEDDYNDSKAEKQKALSDVQDQIAELLFDTSEAGIARRMELESEAAKLSEELAQAEEDRAYQLALQALETEQKLAEDTADIQLTEMEKAQEQYEWEQNLREQTLEDEQYASERRYEIIVQGLDAQTAAQEEALRKQIADIDDYLKQEGTIRNDAMAMIEDKNSGLYQQLLDWNKKYGSGINDDITSMWNTAMEAVKAYSDAINAIPAVNSPKSIQELFDEGEKKSLDGTGSGTAHHSGVDSGFVGGKAKLKSNEEFARLLKGEIVVNSQQMDDFMKITVPSIKTSRPQTESLGNGGFEIGNLMNIVVNGSLDKSVIPDIEKISQRVIGEINKVMLGRGINRRADAFSQ